MGNKSLLNSKNFFIILITLCIFFCMLSLYFSFSSNYKINNTKTTSAATWIDKRASSYDGGNGTLSSPYIISTASQLALLAYNVNNGNTYSGKYFQQTADISLSDYDWVPIGTSFTKCFSGYYISMGYKISNITIASGSNYAGIFGLCDGSYLYGIQSTGLTFSKNEEVYSCGGIVGYTHNDTRIYNCSNTGRVGSSIRKSFVSGGIVGLAENTLIHDCFNEGWVYALNNSGGIVGFAVGSSISHCYNTSMSWSVSNEYSYYGSGGIAGYSSKTEITDCFNTGNILASSTSRKGGIIGYNDGSTITKCYYGGSCSVDYGIASSSSNSGITKITDLDTKSYAKGEEWFTTSENWSTVWDLSYDKIGYCWYIIGEDYPILIFPYNIIVYGNGEGTNATLTLEGVDFNESIEIGKVASKTGYTIDGWKITGNLNLDTAQYEDAYWVIFTTWYDLKDSMTTKSTFRRLATYGKVIFTAQWTANQYTYKIVKNNGEEDLEKTATYDSVISIPNPTKPGYAFAGWTASGLDTSTAMYGTTSNPTIVWDGTTKVTATSFKNLRSTSGTVTLTANWTAYQLDIEYYDKDIPNDSHESYKQVGGTYSYTTYEAAKNVTLLTITKTGYTFLGWLDTEGNILNGTQDFSSKIATSSKTLRLYAQWEANDYILSFDDNNSNQIRYIRDSLSGGSSANASNHWLEIQAFGSDGVNYAHKDKGATSKNNLGTITSSALLNGNIGLSEWQQSGMDIVGNSFQIIDLGQIRDIEYIVVWHYYGDGRTYNKNILEVSVDGINWRTIFSTEDTGKYLEKSHGNKVYVDAYRSKTVTYDNTYGTLPTISKTGYTFAGWYYNNNLITSSTQMTTDQDHMAISKWNVNTYTVQYNGNGNTGGSTVSQTFTYDQTYSLQSNSFTRTGYIFTGWNTQANGTGTNYLAGQSVKNLTSTNGGIVTLYAKWQATWASSGIKQPTDQDSEGYYLISSAEELAWLAYQTENGKLGGKYKQITNIDLSSKIWLPIGRLNAFVGEYNGQGYKITGLKTSDAKDASSEFLESYGGLFGQLTNAPDDSIVKIYNVYIENANISGKTAGIIAGSVSDNVVIENCIVSGTVNGKTIGSVVGVGGQINNCLAINVNISAIGSSSTIKNCLYQLSSGVKGKINFSDYSGWGYNENLFYPIPTAITWYTYNLLTSLTLEEWLNK